MGYVLCAKIQSDGALHDSSPLLNRLHKHTHRRLTTSTLMLMCEQRRSIRCASRNARSHTSSAPSCVWAMYEKNSLYIAWCWCLNRPTIGARHMVYDVHRISWIRNAIIKHWKLKYTHKEWYTDPQMTHNTTHWLAGLCASSVQSSEYISRTDHHYVCVNVRGRISLTYISMGRV